MQRADHRNRIEGSCCAGPDGSAPIAPGALKAPAAKGAGTDLKLRPSAPSAVPCTLDETSASCCRNYRSDGSVFSNEVSTSPFRNPANQITHYIGTQIDVTHRGNRPFVSR